MAENFRRRKSRWEMAETHFPNKVRKDNALPVKAVLSHDKESKSSRSSFKYNHNQFSKWSDMEGSNAPIHGDDFEARQLATWSKRPKSPKWSDMESDHKGSKNSSWQPLSGSQSARGDDNISRDTAGWGTTVDQTNPDAWKQHKEGLKNSSLEPVSGIQSTRGDDNVRRDTAGWGTALDQIGPDAWKQCKESLKDSSSEPVSGSHSARADDNVRRDAAGWGTVLDQTGPDAWRQHNHSVSPDNVWNRSRRSRSPFKGLRHESESWNDRSRKGGRSAAPCRDFVADRHRTGGQFRYLREVGSPRHSGRYHDNDATEIRKIRSERGRYSVHDNKEDIRDSLDQSNYSRNRFSRRHGNDSGGEERHEVYKTSRSAGLCHDFARGRCNRGSMCRYLHHDASSGGGPFRKDYPWERTFDRRDVDASSFRQSVEPCRVTDAPCKYFAKGHCRHGEDCKFSHQVLPKAHSKERRDDDRWNTGLESERSPVWNGPKWGDETAPSWNGPKWGDESATSWDGPKWGDQAATSQNDSKWGDVANMHAPNSFQWMSDSNGAGDAASYSIGIEDYPIKSHHPPSTEPEKNNHQSLPKEVIEKALPSHGQNMTWEVPGKDQNVPSVTTETVVEGTCVQWHPGIMEEVLCGDGEESENVHANSVKSQAAMKYSANNLQTVVSVHDQCFGESSQSHHLAPEPPDAQTITQNEQHQQVLPQVPSNTNLTGQNQLCLLPHNGQSQNLAEQSQHYLSVSPHVSPSEQVDSSNGQNHNSPILPPSAQPNQVSVSEQQCPTSDGMRSVTPDPDSLLPVFTPISVEIKDPSTETLRETLNNSFSLPITDGPNEGNLNNTADLEEKLHSGKQESKHIEQDGDDNKKVSETEIGQRKKEEQIAQSKGVNAYAHIDGEGKRSRDDKGVRMFKFALVEHVKDMLKPTWKEGRLTKEVHKTIVKKVVEKVTSTLQDPTIPWTQERIDVYLSCSKVKLNKLVQAYVQKYGKS
uniref:Zinc finger CCCH domain-containing protein 55 isoform X2 n=1 Tax=Elaeis guineensis var. tenera TaxID=51953 RepID=A0A8N4I9A4_ELAGV|nr:zinc finger CCCH domain-containing protein 55 isoform X2 [Elaeis guineensis]